MIDIHSHILPNIDDGAKNINETYNLINEAKKIGFKGIILTPHYIEGYYEKTSDEIEKMVENIKKNTNIELYIGNEIYISENISELIKDKKASRINGTNYILFEMPREIEPMNLYNIVYEMLSHKYIPILAHPERYTFIYKKPEIILDLIEKGVLMQANYGSIVGIYGKKAKIMVKKFLKNNMIHFLGSDVHTEKTIYPRIPEIINEINSLIGEEKQITLTKINPELMLKNKQINIIKPEEIKFTLREKLIIKG